MLSPDEVVGTILSEHEFRTQGFVRIKNTVLSSVPGLHQVTMAVSEDGLFLQPLLWEFPRINPVLDLSIDGEDFFFIQGSWQRRGSDKIEDIVDEVKTGLERRINLSIRSYPTFRLHAAAKSNLLCWILDVAAVQLNYSVTLTDNDVTVSVANAPALGSVNTRLYSPLAFTDFLTRVQTWTKHVADMITQVKQLTEVR